VGNHVPKRTAAYSNLSHFFNALRALYEIGRGGKKAVAALAAE
jgi:hypothetical protein